MVLGHLWPFLFWRRQGPERHGLLLPSHPEPLRRRNQRRRRLQLVQTLQGRHQASQKHQREYTAPTWRRRDWPTDAESINTAVSCTVKVTIKQKGNPPRSRRSKGWNWNWTEGAWKVGKCAEKNNLIPLHGAPKDKLFFSLFTFLLSFSTFPLSTLATFSVRFISFWFSLSSWFTPPIPSRTCSVNLTALDSLCLYLLLLQFLFPFTESVAACVFLSQRYHILNVDPFCNLPAPLFLSPGFS